MKTLQLRATAVALAVLFLYLLRRLCSRHAMIVNLAVLEQVIRLIAKIRGVLGIGTNDDGVTIPRP
jgi:hypothetical protein